MIQISCNNDDMITVDVTKYDIYKMTIHSYSMYININDTDKKILLRGYCVNIHIFLKK